MPEVAETVQETVLVAGDRTADAPLVSVSPPLHDERGKFAVGHIGMGGRPAGSRKAAALLDRSAPSLTQDLIRRSKKSDKLLAKAIDKVLPDAGRTDTLISVSLSRDDVLAELRRRGITAPDA